MASSTTSGGAPLIDEEELKFQQTKAFLMQADESGMSLYDHLHNVVYAMLEENPDDVANHPERLPDVSSLVKAARFTHGAPSAPASSKPIVHVSQVERAAQDSRLFQKPEPEVITKIEQPTPFTTVTTTTVVPKKAPALRSLVKEAAMWRHCGAGLVDTECFFLDQSIAKLAREKNLEEVRFVGKIFGTRANYLVVSSKRYVAPGETVYEEVNSMPKPPRKKTEVDVQPEPGFKGCNRLSFWVAPHPAADWTLLPDVTPQQINATRKLKKLFTGDLDSPVVAHPHFDGSERVYLRAQLSRIVAATFISPVNALERVDPEEEEEEDEDAQDADEEGTAKRGPKPAKYFPLVRESKEYAPDEDAGVGAVNDLEQWVHSEGHIYETGRQTRVPPKPDVEGEEEAEDDEEEEDEKKEEEEKELLLPVKKDALFAVINVPKEPNEDDENEEEDDGGNGEDGGDDDEEKEEEEGEGDENRPIDDEDVPDDDPLRQKITAWTVRMENALCKRHGVVVVRSARWPGAFAYAAEGGRRWGCVYFGNGLKSTDHAFAPTPAPPIQREVDDLTEVMDATAATEKLVLRGEEPREVDSEDEKEEGDDDEEQEDDA